MTFRMLRCRELLETHTEFTIIKSLVENIEREVDACSNGTFFLAYSLIDSACKTILSHLDIEGSSNDDLPTRFKRTLRVLNLAPPDYDNKSAHEGLAKTVRGLGHTVEGLCELRNKAGTFSHGKIGDTPNLESLQVQLAAESADLIVSYLFQAHTSYPTKNHGVIYEDWTDFNEYTDEAYSEIEVYGQVFLPSQVLYRADPDHSAYREALIEYQSIKQEEEIEDLDDRDKLPASV